MVFYGVYILVGCFLALALVLTSMTNMVWKGTYFIYYWFCIQDVVASVASDPKVWDAVMENPALKQFMNSQQNGKYFSMSQKLLRLLFRVPLRCL